MWLNESHLCSFDPTGGSERSSGFKVDLEEFRHLMRLELRREETRKAALHALIEEIVVYPDALIEVKYRIRNRYRTASKAVEDGRYPHVCSATAVHTQYVG